MLLRHSTKVLCTTISTSLTSPGNYVCLVSTMTNPNPMITRSYANGTRRKPSPSITIKPLDVENTLTKKQRRKAELAEVYDWNMYSQMSQEELADIEDVDNELEPNVDNLGDAYFDYTKERYRMRKIKTRQRLFRKNFKEPDSKEISLLTWAEKENIRFLHYENPEEWTPERLATAFPISEEGVEKLIRIKSLTLTPKEVRRHDERVKIRIDKIKAGDIELTPELQDKMEIRKRVPFVIGATINDNMSEPPKPLGEFARIVAPLKKIKEAEEKAKEFAQNSVENNKDHVWGHFANEMNRLRIGRTEPLTLSQFEEQLEAPADQNHNLNQSASRPLIKENSHNKAMVRVTQQDDDRPKTLKEIVPEVSYLLSLNKRNKAESAKTSKVLEEQEIEAAQTQREASSKHFIRNRVHKFKSTAMEDPRDPEARKEFDDVPTINVENGNLYIYDSKTGYQRPFASPDSEPIGRIKIPKNKRITGGTYQVKDCFYDEYGNFLYRVI